MCAGPSPTASTARGARASSPQLPSSEGEVETAVTAAPVVWAIDSTLHSFCAKSSATSLSAQRSAEALRNKAILVRWSIDLIGLPVTVVFNMPYNFVSDESGDTAEPCTAVLFFSDSSLVFRSS